MRQTLRGAIDRAAWATGATALMLRRIRAGLTVLMYHRVLPDDVAAAYPLASLAMGASAFRGQVGWLREHCDVLTVREALTQLRSGNASARPRVAITFDDGYADNHDLAAPILEQAGIRATFYLTAGVVGTNELLWHDLAVLCWQKLGAARAMAIAGDALGDKGLAPAGEPVLRDIMARLKAAAPAMRGRALAAMRTEAGELPADGYRLMTHAQARALHERGHEIGSHTVSHALLPQLGDADLATELAGSRPTLERLIGAPVCGLAYPNGDHDDRVVAAATAAGYEYAVTTRPGLACTGADGWAMRLPRRDITTRRVTRAGSYDACAFAAEVCGLHEALR